MSIQSAFSMSLLLLLIFPSIACTRSDSVESTGKSVDIPPKGVLPLPGPLPGWEQTFDGIQCEHPPVQADCVNGWCRIPPGCFIKGSPLDEVGHPAKKEDQRAVTLTHGFWIQQYEMTQAQWATLANDNPSRAFPAEPGGDCIDDPQCPVGGVNWFEAVAFANLMSTTHDPPLTPCYVLSDCTGSLGHAMKCGSITLTAPNLYQCNGYRLPTATEYEYAVRASTTGPFYMDAPNSSIPIGPTSCEPWSPATDVAWYCGNSERFTHPVGQKRPNAWHLYDMLGNAYEWVNDEDNGQAPPPGPLTDLGGQLSTFTSRMIRGGAATTWPTLLRSASSLGASWDFSFPQHGFRLVRTILNDTSNEKP